MIENLGLNEWLQLVSSLGVVPTLFFLMYRDFRSQTKNIIENATNREDKYMESLKFIAEIASTLKDIKLSIHELQQMKLEVCEIKCKLNDGKGD